MKVEVKFKNLEISFNADNQSYVKPMIKEILAAHAEFVQESTPKVIYQK